MANHKSAKKRVRQNIKRNVVNKMRKTEVRTVLKSVREAIKKKQKEGAASLFLKVQSLLSKLGQTSALRSKTAARLTSRLQSQINKI